MVKVLCYSVNKFKSRKLRRMIGSEAVLTTVKQVVRREMVMNLVKQYSFKNFRYCRQNRNWTIVFQ